MMPWNKLHGMTVSTIMAVSWLVTRRQDVLLGDLLPGIRLAFGRTTRPKRSPAVTTGKAEGPHLRMKIEMQAQKIFALHCSTPCGLSIKAQLQLRDSVQQQMTSCSKRGRPLTPDPCTCKAFD